MNQLDLAQSIDRLGQRVFIGVSPAADRRLDARLGQPLGVADADVLGPATRVTYKTALAFGLANIKSLSSIAQARISV
ncbi:hypothetical protein NECAME_17829 [Necator americanus]|uniref:Uncharacterized protein n=1 Tax=Necator americanus TaxID=51031 RepID=W2TI27_NECAM|nr:hypothetical protein NECAME_17829 [Necator americanus]ETN81735.1 hypothetical protein NECAME_17829 [Necator americanus]